MQDYLQIKILSITYIFISFNISISLWIFFFFSDPLHIHIIIFTDLHQFSEKKSLYKKWNLINFYLQTTRHQRDQWKGYAVDASLCSLKTGNKRPEEPEKRNRFFNVVLHAYVRVYARVTFASLHAKSARKGLQRERIS